MPTVSLPAPTGVDDSVPLTAWFDGLAAGTTVEADGGDTYRLDHTLAIVDLDGLIFHGNGVTFGRTDAPGRNGALISITGGDGWEWHDTTIIGANPNGGFNGDYVVAKESHHCLFVAGALNFRVTGCEMRNGFGDCIYLSRRKIGPAGHRESYQWCTGGTVDGCKLHHSGRQLLTMQGAEDCEIVDCDLWESRRSMIEIEPNVLSFNGIDNVWVHGCRFGAGRFAMVTNTGSGSADHFTFEDNVYARTPTITCTAGAAGPRRVGWHILNNRYLTALTASPEIQPLESCTHAGNPSGGVFTFDRYDGVEIVGNEANVDDNRTPSMVLAVLTDCSDVDVHDNDVWLVHGGDGPSQCDVVGPGEELRLLDEPVVDPVPWVPGSDWSWTIAQAMLDAAVSCEAVCDRRWVSDGGLVEQPPPGCPCQLVAVVVEGPNGLTPKAICGSGRFATIRVVLDLCVELPGREEIADPVAVNTRAQANASTRWLIMQGLLAAASTGTLTVLDGPALFGPTWAVTVDGWHLERSTGGMARWSTTWTFADAG